MKIALFTNIDDKPFEGYWDGKKYTFQPGASKHMQGFKAAHFAKHLTNKMLIQKGLERCTSPKFPEQVPQFTEIFNKICVLISDDDEGDDDEIAAVMKNRPTEEKTAVDNEPPQVIGGEENGENDEFDLENKPAA